VRCFVCKEDTASCYHELICKYFVKLTTGFGIEFMGVTPSVFFLHLACSMFMCISFVALLQQVLDFFPNVLYQSTEVTSGG